MTLLEESCYLCHRGIIETEQERHWTQECSVPFGHGVNGDIGWLIHHQVKKKMLREAKEKRDNERRAFQNQIR